MTLIAKYAICLTTILSFTSMLAHTIRTHVCVKIYPGLEAQNPILITGRHHLVFEFCYHIGIVDSF